MEDEFSDGDICGEWVYVGDAQQPISQARTRQQSDDAIGEGMKSWDEISKAVNVTCEQTQQVHACRAFLSIRFLVVVAELFLEHAIQPTHLLFFP